ncbi:MAG: hypothetical protein ACYC5T_06665 [Thiobacillus sp.]
MDIGFFIFDHVHQEGAPATRPQARLGTRLPLSLVVAGPGLPPPCFAAATRPDAPSGASNYGF